MSAPSRALILLLALLWQTLAWVTPFGISARTNELVHLTEHAQALDHHHHADASLHVADEVGNDKHLHPDSGAQSFALHHLLARHVFVASSVAMPFFADLEPLSVVPDGLLRPPQVLA